MTPRDTGSPFVGVKRLALRIVLSLVLLAAVAPGLYRSYRVFRADRIARSGSSIADLDRALRFDPENSRLWWLRGRLHHFSIEAPDMNRAAQDYRRALELNPRIGQAWMGLADCLDRQGRLAEAEAAINRAIEVQPFSPLIRWQAGNIYLRRQNLPKMYECFNLACRYDPSKLQIAMEVAWKADSEHAAILEKLVPDTPEANLSYVNFLASKNELDLAAPAWKRWVSAPIPEDMQQKPSLAFFYMDRLLSAARPFEALGVWDDVLRKTRTGLADPRARRPHRSPLDRINWVWNGSFENDILNGGFDWRLSQIRAVQYRVDVAERIDRLKSLRVTFSAENLAGVILHQIVPIPEPGRYQLNFFLRTENLTTDQTPYVLVQGYPAAAGVSAQSSLFPARSEWSRVSVPFEAPRGCNAVMISLQRNKSQKFDNQIKGALWLDGFSLHAAAGRNEVNTHGPALRQ